MSSTPPNPPQGHAPPAGANAPQMKVRRPKKAADPLVRPKKRPPPRPGQASALAANGKLGTAAPRSTPNATQPAARSPQPNANANLNANSKPAPSADDLTVNGFSGPLVSDTYVDYPLVTTKRAWREGLKFHVAKFASKKNIDPRDEEQFTRPLRLQRRDPRAVAKDAAAAAANAAKEENSEQKPTRGSALTEAEREELEVKKAARAKEREENLAQIAPSVSPGGGGTQKRTNAMKQKTQQVFKAEMTPQEIAKARVRYEEALPWHLEDFDNKNLWVGNYEAAMSGTYAMFILDESGKMRMVPIDKWYKFAAKNQFRALTIEEAEKHMAKKAKDPRWFMEKEEARAHQKELAQYAQHSKVYTGRVEPGAAGGLDGEDMDFEEDRFADDEEHVGLFDEDEDAQIADKRIKNDQLKANIFDLKDEKEYDQEESREKREKEALKNYGRRVRKALQKREKNFDYSSGSDDNPFSSDESSDDTETERQKEEQRKSQEERDRKEKGKESERTSGASTRGSNTPSDRPKHTDALKKASTLAPPGARKRLGSPNLSDASGTDTSRKRAKNKHPASSQADQSQPVSRPTSPAPNSPHAQQRQKAQADGPKTNAAGKKRSRSGAGAGAGSDTDRGGGASAAEMSDSTATTANAPKKLKLNLKPSKDGTPAGSRAASPGRAAPPGGSRASSPDGAGRGRTGVSTPRGSPSPPAGAGAAPATGSFPTAGEIRATIPAAGISIGELIKLFKPRIGNEKSDRTRFISIIKEVSDFSLEDKLVRPKAE